VEFLEGILALVGFIARGVRINSRNRAGCLALAWGMSKFDLEKKVLRKAGRKVVVKWGVCENNYVLL
jgi:hypothetical protein